VCASGQVCNRCYDDTDEPTQSFCVTPEEEPSAPGFLACGYRYCDTATEYCSRVSTWESCGEADKECAPLPAACDPASPSCDCLAGTFCGTEGCSVVDGGLVSDCYDTSEDPF
jgi:hypothetical protein